MLFINADAEFYAGRAQALHDALAAWWTLHAPRLADLPARRNLNAVRGEFLESFVVALAPLGTLDRFKLAGVVATWWTDTLPDFKTLLENGFPGVIDGWVDAIADAVEDDDNADPAFDPFGHKLVRRTMADYLEHIAAAKADIVRLKGEKEAFEQSNAPNDLDEEELAAWNYARDLDRHAREIKAEHRDALKELAKLEKAAAKARARYRELTNRFVEELKTRCAVLRNDEKQALVLELFAQDVQGALDAAVAEKQQALVRFIEGLWDKYRVTLADLRKSRLATEDSLRSMLKAMRYV